MNYFPPPPPPPPARKRPNWLAIGIALVAAAIITGIAQNNSDSAATALPTTVVAAQTTVPPPPTTVAPPTTVRPYVAPAQPQTRSGTECVQYIDLGNVSVLAPYDWSNYCDGVLAGVEAWVEGSYSDQAAVCDMFWNLSDNLILENFQAGGYSRDESIGLIDFFWTVC